MSKGFKTVSFAERQMPSVAEEDWDRDLDREEGARKRPHPSPPSELPLPREKPKLLTDVANFMRSNKTWSKYLAEEMPTSPSDYQLLDLYMNVSLWGPPGER